MLKVVILETAVASGLNLGPTAVSRIILSLLFFYEKKKMVLSA